ncbi:MAG: 23S rRNA (adenine(2503)-C(2))-methyltransferase RlmN [bacterium]
MLSKLLQNEPKFRANQITQGLLNPAFSGWEDFKVLPKNLREKIEKDVAWMSVKEKDLQKSNIDESQKALLELQDGNLVETVLMKNSKGNATICVSSQVGCSIGCAFCNTGKMGLKRNLTKEEIIDQYRFWLYKGNNNARCSAGVSPQRTPARLKQTHLVPASESPRGDSDGAANNISNIVFMGMGEPFLNYENVRDSIIEILKYTEIGKNHIVVSTVGIIEKLNNILTDELWPNVRIAISLHSAVNETRKKLIPVHTEKFFKELIQWSEEYHQKFGGRNLYLSIEYTLLGGVNDSFEEAEALIGLLKKLGRVKVNLIPYNQTACGFKPAKEKYILKFQDLIKQAGFTCTLRKSLGADIHGACGQLAGTKNLC